MFGLAFWHIWLIVALLLLVAEIIAPGTFLLFFSIGAFAAAIAAGAGLHVYIQLSVFAVVAFILAFLIRPMLVKKQHDSARTNVQAMVGERVKVLERIEPDGEGVVKVWGERWRAFAGETIEAGEAVVIESVDGTKVYVKRTRS